MSEIAVAPWSVVERLLLAAGAGPAKLQEAVQVAGLDAVGRRHRRRTRRTLRSAVVGRVGANRLEITSGAQLVRRTVELDHAGLRLAAVAEAAAVLRFDAVDLLEGLFGPVDGRRHNSREVRWSDSMTQFSPDQGLAGARACWRSGTGCPPRCTPCWPQPPPARADLGALAVRYGSDKWADLHWYTEHYEHHFSRFQDAPVRVLEIGIGGYHAPNSVVLRCACGSGTSGEVSFTGWTFSRKPGTKGTECESCEVTRAMRNSWKTWRGRSGRSTLSSTTAAMSTTTSRNPSNPCFRTSAQVVCTSSRISRRRTGPATAVAMGNPRPSAPRSTCSKN